MKDQTMTTQILPLDSLGPVAKLERARKHFAELKELIEHFKSRKTYSIRSEQQTEGGEITLRLSVTEFPPFIEWALIIGDVVHNLRSALDHLAYSLVGLENKSADPSKISFPIYKNFNNFSSGVKTKLAGAHPDAITLIESFKPYGGGNDMFYSLSLLDNFDKHRLLTVTYALPKQIPSSFKIDVPAGYSEPETTVRFPKKFMIEDGAIVGTVKCTFPIHPTKDQDDQISLQIVFDQPEVVSKQDVLIFLQNAVSLIEEVIKAADELVVRLYPHLGIPRYNVPMKKD